MSFEGDLIYLKLDLKALNDLGWHRMTSDDLLW